MSPEIRTIAPGEAAEWLACSGVAFFSPRPPGFTEWWLTGAELDRTWGAFEGSGQVVGTLRSFATALTVPGPAAVRASAISGVAVLPTHRRRGLLDAMIRRELAASTERGEAVGILVASEWPIYGRFGYGPAAESASYRVDGRAARFDRATAGTLEVVTLEELARHAPGLHDAHRRARPGAIERSRRFWERQLGLVEIPGAEQPPSFAALCRDGAGTASGYLRWRGDLGWDRFAVSWATRGAAEVLDLVATTDEAYGALWRFCCELDLVGELRAGSRAVDEPLPFMLTDGRAVQQVERHDFLWVRPLDVVAALTGRRYGCAGRLVLEVHDPLGICSGTYRLESDGGDSGASSCRRSAEPADLRLPAGTLGAAYLGGTSWRRLGRAGLVEEVRPGSLDLADAMFHSPLAPWCDTHF